MQTAGASSTVAIPDACRRLLDAATDAMLIVAADGAIAVANAAAARLFRDEPEALVGVSVEDLMPERFRAAHRDLRAEYRAGRRPRPMNVGLEVQALRRDGTEFSAAVMLAALDDEHVLATVHDVTERRRTEAELRRMRSDMDQMLALHVASETAAAIAHELNQPLNALAAYTEAARRLLRAGNPRPERLLHALEHAAQQAQRAGRVVRELLEFLRKGEVKTEIVDLNEVVREALAIVEANGFGGFEAVVDLAPDLRPVRANRLQVEKVLVNLLRNGVEAMRAAGIAAQSIVIGVTTAAEGEMALVTVRDSGPGLDPVTARRLFEPFFTTKRSGLGMGLAISRSLIEANGGSLWFDPDSGPGATFRFTLPFA